LIVSQKTEDIVKDSVYAIDFEKVLPKPDPIFPVKRDSNIDFATITRHKRAKLQRDWDILKGEFVTKKRLLPDDYKSIIEVSCRAEACPLPLNMDVYSSGACYGCIYCFAKLFEQSLYSAFYDDYEYTEVRSASKKYITETLSAYFRGKGGGEVQKAVDRRIPVRLGIRTEDFLPWIEKEQQRSLHAMKLIQDFGYPMMINTKTDMLLEGKWFKTLTEMDGSIAVQVSLITCDDEVSKKLEMMAPVSSRRWEVVKTLNEVGIRCIPRIEPTMAYINGTPDQIEDYAEHCKENGAPFVTMDTYHYFANAQGIRENFEIQGFDFERMFEATSEQIMLGSALLERVMFALKKRGVQAGTFNFHSIPFNDMDVCCGIPDTHGGGCNFNTYNTLTACRKLVKGEVSELSWSEFNRITDKPLKAEFEKTIHAIWRKDKFSPWAPDICGGVEVCGQDEDGFIYDFKEERMRNDYERLVERFGG